MTSTDAVAALKRLGLSTYEAEVFVALQGLGTASAAAISDASSVPRSQVYGAADDLAEKGLVEVVESSPKRYRPVDLATAREQLRRRQEREREAVFETLASIDTPTGGDEPTQAVSTLRGRVPVANRVESLVAGASETVIVVAPGPAQLSEGIAAALRDRAAADVDVTLLTTEPAIRERFTESSVRVIVMPADAPSDYAGRTVMVDDEAVLLSVVTPDSAGADEEAMWTAGTNIARILAQYVHSGMEAGMEGSDTRNSGNHRDDGGSGDDGQDRE